MNALDARFEETYAVRILTVGRETWRYITFLKPQASLAKS